MNVDCCACRSVAVLCLGNARLLPLLRLTMLYVGNEYMPLVFGIATKPNFWFSDDL